MTEDARFEDGREAPLRLLAQDEEGLKILSTLCQDSIIPVGEMTWRKSERRFALLLNRFRWEDRPVAERLHRKYERVQSLLVFNDVQGAATMGIDRAEKDMVLSVLSLDFTPAEDGTGTIEIALAGDGGIRLQVECIDVVLKDVTRPYLAPSGKAPSHD